MPRNDPALWAFGLVSVGLAAAAGPTAFSWMRLASALALGCAFVAAASGHRHAFLGAAAALVTAIALAPPFSSTLYAFALAGAALLGLERASRATTVGPMLGPARILLIGGAVLLGSTLLLPRLADRGMPRFLLAVAAALLLPALLVALARRPVLPEETA